ncbi:uncharacterized protein TNCV_2451702 [Trichonephila clavipes]|nr:uncharacterized protein TNCV_2451702 [Trichonephila clavipes]
MRWSGLNQKECVQRLQLAFGDESPCRATVFRRFKEFCSGHNSLQDEEHTERPAVIPDNVSAIRKLLMVDNRCTYQMIQKELNFGSAAIYKIIHEELHMKQVTYRWVPHNLSTKKKSVSEPVKESLKLLNDGGHHNISKIVTGDETSTGLIKSIKLEGQKTITANWYTPKCLPDILQEVNVRGLMFHHNNASSHAAGLTVEFLKQKQIKMIEHPPYSPGLAMCDF